MVDEPVEKNPFAPVKPMAVVVELYPVLTVNGKAAEVIVIGEEPRTLNVEHDVPPLQVTDVVATLPSFAGEPELVVQYESCPAVSLVEVETDWMYELSVVCSGMTYPVSRAIAADPPTAYLLAVMVRPVGTEMVPVATVPTAPVPFP